MSKVHVDFDLVVHVGQFEKENHGKRVDRKKSLYARKTAMLTRDWNNVSIVFVHNGVPKLVVAGICT